VRTDTFDFEVPSDLIAQTPAAHRDSSRLLVLHRESRRLEHRRFADFLDYLRPGDVLVLNDSRVIPARLRGENAKTGGQFELLLVEENGVNDWWAMVRPGKRARPGTRINLKGVAGGVTAVQGTVLEKNEEGHCRLAFEGVPNILVAADHLGEVPLPPYIERSGRPGETDRERYQTVFARQPGSVAAPTAGLHFTEELLNRIKRLGVEVCFVTLHVGLGTFAPVKSEEVSGHVMHEERYELSLATAQTIHRVKRQGGRVIAVGTTTLRVLETAFDTKAGSLITGRSRTRIFIYPPYEFRIVDVLLTNFHLPGSTLVMLVSAFAAPGKTEGSAMILSAYAEAVAQRYRFYSYGDAMLLV
jgi:S-adenosylmethionine:tRNA ribosyltransferase-isomerase